MEKIYVFGRGEYFKKKYISISEKYEVCGFIDNAVMDEEEDAILHIPVYNPSKITALPPNTIYCVASDFISMWNQLKRIGVEDKRIKFGAMIAPLQPGIETEAFSKGETIVADGEFLLYSSKELGEFKIVNYEDIKKIIRKKDKKKNCNVNNIKNLTINPVSRMFGCERGKAVDRFYIESFLETNSKYICGTVLEVASNQYTLKYGKSNVKKSIISHVKGWSQNSVIVNFETGEGVKENYVDCLICTQTLQYIFDVCSAMRNIYKMLKKGGTALITVPGIKPLCEYDDDKWGEHWSFTRKSLERLCEMVCGQDNYHVFQYGNVKVATAYLYGLCIEDMNESDFEYQDSQYPFLICAKIIKEKRD